MEFLEKNGDSKEEARQITKMLKKGVGNGQRLKEIIKNYSNKEQNLVEPPMISVIFSEVLQSLSPRSKGGNPEATPGGVVMRITHLFRQMYLRKYLQIDTGNMTVDQVYCYVMAFMAEVLKHDDEPSLPKMNKSP
jgi:hypothetical protein